MLGLARADRYLRARVGAAGEVDTADLDPERRAGWTAEQWSRAEAAGLVALAPPPKPEVPAPASSPPLPPLHPRAPGATDWSAGLDLIEEEAPPVWFDDLAEDWRTSFPPPADFDGEEEGEYGDPDYARSLTDPEHAIMTDLEREESAGLRQEGEAARDAWFAARQATDEEDEGGDGNAGGDWDGQGATPASATSDTPFACRAAPSHARRSDFVVPDRAADALVNDDG